MAAAFPGKPGRTQAAAAAAAIDDDTEYIVTFSLVKIVINVIKNVIKLRN